MDGRIKKITAIEVLDSRGNPTVKVNVTTSEGIFFGIAPCGASTGSGEIKEKRDNNHRYFGKGVKAYCKLFNEEFAKQFIGVNLKRDYESIEELLSEEKAKIGGNFSIAFSIALLRAKAFCEGLTPYEFISEFYFREKFKMAFPKPMMNLINGGVHAGIDNDFQEHLLVITRAKDIVEAIRIGSECYHQLKKNLMDKYGVQAGLVADEGGFAIPNISIEERLEKILKAAEELGYGDKVRVSIDCAASEFFDKDKGKYNLRGKIYYSEELVDYLKYLVNTFNIFSIEDGMAENDFTGWKVFYEEIGKKLGRVVIGDDLTVTNSKRIENFANKYINGVIIKPNQIGTIKETMKAILSAKEHDIKTIISHRSGDTEDPIIADIAFSVGSDFCKFGAPCRAERTCKYNRLLEIFAERNE